MWIPSSSLLHTRRRGRYFVDTNYIALTNRSFVVSSSVSTHTFTSGWWKDVDWVSQSVIAGHGFFVSCLTWSRAGDHNRIWCQTVLCSVVTGTRFRNLDRFMIVGRVCVAGSCFHKIHISCIYCLDSVIYSFIVSLCSYLTSDFMHLKAEKDKTTVWNTKKT